MSKELNLEIKSYLDQVCSQIKHQAIHDEIKQELEGHIFELIEDYKIQKMSDEEAVSQAIRQMGDPVTIGKQLHRTHKPKMDWSIIALLLLFSSISLIGLYSIDLSQEISYSPFFSRQLFSFSIGIVLFCFFLFFDYRKIKRYSIHLFIVHLCFMFSMIYITGLGYVSIFEQRNWPEISLGILIITMAGLFANWNWEQRFSMLKALFILAGSAIIFLAFRTNLYLVQLLLIYNVLILISKASWKQKISIISLVFASSSGLLYLIAQHKPYIAARLIGYFKGSHDTMGVGYPVHQSLSVIKNAGLWGHGLNSPKSFVPSVQTEFIFTYFVHMFGWIFGAIIIGSILFFIIRLVSTVQKVNDRFGMMIMVGTVTLIGIKLVWGVLMTLGLAPHVGISLPFMSFGGTHLVVEMALLGLTLGIYRRKDIVRERYS